MPAIGDFIDKDSVEGLTSIDHQLEMDTPAEEPTVKSRFDLSLLKAQTGAGQVEDYQEHALNYNGSKSVARIIRGLTGLLGELNYAVVDIIMGVLEFSKDRKKAVVINGN